VVFLCLKAGKKKGVKIVHFEINKELPVPDFSGKPLKIPEKSQLVEIEVPANQSLKIVIKPI
jgi:hypothetical protein